MKKTKKTPPSESRLKKAFAVIERHLKKSYGTCDTWCPDCVCCRMWWALETLKVRLVMDYNMEKKPCDHHGPFEGKPLSLKEKAKIEKLKFAELVELLKKNPAIDYKALAKKYGAKEEWFL